MKAKLRKMDSFPTGYSVHIDGVRVGEVYKVQNGIYADFIWLGYLLEMDFPLEAMRTRREAVAEVVRAAEREEAS